MLRATSELDTNRPAAQLEQRDKEERLKSTFEGKSQLIERFRGLLGTKNLNVNLLSRNTERIFGVSSPYFIPHNFCYNLLANRSSPHICQVFALSKLTGYCFSDCLTFFGFSPDRITRFQLELHQERTVLLPPVTYDKGALFPFLGSVVNPGTLEHTGPLSNKVGRHGHWRISRIEECHQHPFLYARIGQKDAVAFPDLVPGSIVRVDQRRVAIQSRDRRNGYRQKDRPLYLIDYPGGLVCSHVDLVDKDHILLSPRTLPFATPQYRQYCEAAILGTVDAEIRPQQNIRLPDFTSFARFARAPGTRRTLPRQAPLSDVLRFYRERNGVTFRRAHGMSLEIAKQLGSANSMISTGSFVEFEATNSPPRHIEKLFSLCVAYNLDLWTLLRALGLPLDEAGHVPVPPCYMPDGKSDLLPSNNGDDSLEPTFCSYIGEMIAEIPLFLAYGFPHLLPGLEISSRDLFWVGRQEPAYHPWLEGASIVAVNSARNSEIVDSKWLEPWERPIYLVYLRDDRYMIGFCSFERGKITLVPHPECKVPPLQFIEGQEAEVIGRIIAIARTLPR